ncbi:MAG: efflux RND transporter periplasmic adaptor subunit [Bacteroidales bacterium]|nr:efflux RND transporter periplasmic adaptor subunit [Bacteroidales bacterium]
MKSNYIMAVALAAFALCSVACSRTSTAADQSDLAMRGDTVSVNPESPLAKRLEVITVAESDYSASFSASGIVQAEPSKYAEVAAPFAGRIVKSFVRLGQSVGAGTALFQINSTEFHELTTAYFSAREDKNLADRALARARRLQQSNMISQREMEEAESEAEIKRQEFVNAESALRVFGVNLAALTPGQPLTVVAPLSGKVVADNLVPGQYVKDDADPVMTIADISRVWVVCKIKEKDYALVSNLENVEVHISAIPGEVFTGKILHISDLLDPETRSLEVIVECDNADGRIKPNMYATVALTDAPVRKIIIPTSALMQGEGQSYVMREVAADTYVRVPVEVESTDSSDAARTVIASGLEPGQRIVAAGAYYLFANK